MINTKFYTSRSHSLSPNFKRRMSEQLTNNKHPTNALSARPPPAPLVSPVLLVPPAPLVSPVLLVPPVPQSPVRLALPPSHTSHLSQPSQPSQPSQTSHLFLTDNKQLTHSCKKINVKIFVN